MMGESPKYPALARSPVQLSLVGVSAHKAQRRTEERGAMPWKAGTDRELHELPYGALRLGHVPREHDGRGRGALAPVDGGISSAEQSPAGQVERHVA